MNFVMEGFDFVIDPVSFCHGVFDFVMAAVQSQSWFFP